MWTALQNDPRFPPVKRECLPTNRRAQLAEKHLTRGVMRRLEQCASRDTSQVEGTRAATAQMHVLANDGAVVTPIVGSAVKRCAAVAKVAV